MPNVTTSSSNRSRKVTILVVEDNADQWFIIHWVLLQCFPEVEAIWVQDSKQAIIYLESCAQDVRELPKLILLDLYLPQRQQGWNLLEAIKAHYLFREMPVIILSQSADPEDITKSYILRANSYIVKPSGYEKWLDCITAFRHYWWDAVTLPKYN